MILGNKLKRSGNKSVIQASSLSNSNRERNYLKNSELVRYIDSYLFQSKQQAFPLIEKKLQKAFPSQNSKPIHTLNAPCRVSNKPDDLYQIIFSKSKRRTPVFSDMKKKFHQSHRRHKEVAKSHDDKMLMYIQGISDSRPKSVLLNKKVSFIMQTDDFM